MPKVSHIFKIKWFRWPQMIMTGTAFTDDLHVMEKGQCSVVRLWVSNDASGSRLPDTVRT